MAISNQKIFKNLLVLSGVLLFAGFLFFIPQETYAVNFTASWYQDHGGEKDYSCENGYWRARVELRDYLGEPLLADKLIVRVVWYSHENPDQGIIIYNVESKNLTSHIFETLCEIEIKDSQDTIILEIQAEKEGFHTMKAANNPRVGGQTLNQSKWSKTLHLAPLTTEEPNLTYLFPDNNQWISGADSEMKLFVDKAPRPENITEIKIEIKHNETGIKVFHTITTDIDKGEVVFPRPVLTEQGQYTWRIVSMRSTPSIFYNEYMNSIFNFDSNPPSLYYLNGGSNRSEEKQAPYIWAVFRDLPPSPGMDKIELYLNDGQGGPLNLVKTCTSPVWPRPVEYTCLFIGNYELYLNPRTYYYYAIGYDYLGNKTQVPVESFTIYPLQPSRLVILSSVDDSAVTGVPFEVTAVTPSGPNLPQPGSYQTNKTFTSYYEYTVTLKAPESFNGKPFSFWIFGITPRSSQEISVTVPLGIYFPWTMNFGVSRLTIYKRALKNVGLMSPDLINKIDQIKTRIEQKGGTPSNLLGPYGYRDFTTDYYVKTVIGEINNLVLRAYDSEDDILKFDDFWNSPDAYFCYPDSEDKYQCEGSISYGAGWLTPRYKIQRKIEVKAYLGSDPTEGVNIVGEGKMEEGETPYTFSSTGNSNEFVGTLWAPPSIIDDEGEEALFGYWSGCQSVTADGLGCYIGTGTWYDNIAATVIAHYTSEPPPPPGYCEDVPNGQCKPSYPPKYCNNGTLINYCAICGCPPGQLCDETKNIPYGECVPTYTLSVRSDPIDNILIQNSPGYTGYEGFTPYDKVDILAGTNISLTAPEEHIYNGDIYKFLSWSDCDNTSERICEVTMSKDKTVTAAFASNQPPYIEPGSQTTAESYCNVFAGQGQVDFQWIYRDDDLDPQTQFDFRVNDVNNVNDANPEIDRSVSGLNNPDGTINNQAVIVGSEINFGTTYYWWAKVYDNQGNDSGWVAGPSFSTDAHAWPWIDFKWVPERPTVDEIVYFTDLSEAYGGAYMSSWNWMFQNGNPSSLDIQNPTTTFSAIEPEGNRVDLEACDDTPAFQGGPYCCPGFQKVNVTFLLPKWKEVPPISWFGKLSANISNFFTH